MARSLLLLLVLAACALLAWVVLGTADRTRAESDVQPAPPVAADSAPSQVISSPAAPARAPGRVDPPPPRPATAGPARVLFLEGRVLDADSGAPIAGARVSAEWATPLRGRPHLPMRLAQAVGLDTQGTPAFQPLAPMRVPSPAAVTTDEQGRFRWMVERHGDTDPSRCDVFASAAGYVPASVGHPAPGRFLRIPLRRAVAFEVRVLDADGAPIRGATVRVRPSDARSAWCGHAASATSDADGRAVLDGLATGRLELRADHPDFMPSQVHGVRVSAAPCELHLGRAARVAFVLRTSDGGAPRGATLQWTGERGGAHGRLQIPLSVDPRTDAGVLHSRPLRLPADAGRLQLSIGAPGYAPWSRSLDLRAGDAPRTVDVSLLRE
jgi:protocatechuate 3,4-dioxygenase beta subunit